jgi:hypothetical protein
MNRLILVGLVGDILQSVSIFTTRHAFYSRIRIPQWIRIVLYAPAMGISSRTIAKETLTWHRHARRVLEPAPLSAVGLVRRATR